MSVRVITALLLLVVSGTVFAQTSPLKATLTLSPAETLPGIPVTAELAVENTGRTAVELPMYFGVRVRPAGATESFLLHFGFGFVRPLPVEDEASISIPPKATATVRWTAKPQILSPIFDVDEHGSLNKPGSYELQVFLFRRGGHLVSDAYWSGPDPTELFEKQSVVASTTAMLTVRAPEGSDAAIWDRVRTATGGRFEALEKLGKSAIEEMFDAYPTSRYAPFIAAYLPRERWISGVEHAITVAPEHVADQLRIRLARRLRAEAYENRVSDRKRAEEMWDRAVRLLSDVSKTKDREAQVLAREELESMDEKLPRQ